MLATGKISWKEVAGLVGRNLISLDDAVVVMCRRPSLLVTTSSNLLLCSASFMEMGMDETPAIAA
jgi:hypothetical protein